MHIRSVAILSILLMIPTFGWTKGACTKKGCSSTVSLGLWFSPDVAGPLLQIRDKQDVIFDECKLFKKISASDLMFYPAMYKMVGRIDITFLASKISNLENLTFETVESCKGKSKKLKIDKVERDGKQKTFPNGEECDGSQGFCTSEHFSIYFK